MTTEKCTTCNRDPERMNSAIAECSHVDCPNRRKAWSERPDASSLYRGPWKKNVSKDPLPLDVAVKKGKTE